MSRPQPNTGTLTVNKTSRPQTNTKRLRNPTTDIDTTVTEEVDRSKRKQRKTSPKNTQNTTKATLWIESRRPSPRKNMKVSHSASAVSSPQVSVSLYQSAKSSSSSAKEPFKSLRTNERTQILSAKKTTPLRLAVLKRAQTVHKMSVAKNQQPMKVTKIHPPMRMGM